MFEGGLRLDIWQRCGFWAWFMWTFIARRAVAPDTGDFGPCKPPKGEK